MQTTALVIENVVGGFLAFLWMGLAILSLFDFDWIPGGVLKGLTPFLFLFLIPFAYMFGVLFDRLWDFLTKWGLAPAKRNVSHAQRLHVFSYSEQTERFFDYIRSRLRIARATIWNSVLITGTALVFVGIRLPIENENIKIRMLFAIAVSGIGLFYLALFAFRKINNTYNEQLDAAEEAFFSKKNIFTPKIQKAIQCSVDAHKGQMRKVKDVPYVVHPLSVGMILARTGAPDDVIAAGLLHDAIEESKGRITKEIIDATFGPEVARMVNDVTDQDSI